MNASARKRRLVGLAVALGGVAGGCSPAGSGPADPATEDRYYSLFLGEALKRGEGWWGYPPPGHYCVAIVSGSAEPRLAEGRDPSPKVLDDLGRAHPGRAFHPASVCGEHPFHAPTGERAGFLWVAPLDTRDPRTLAGGWTVEHDMTEWVCSFLEPGGVVELQECVKWSES